MTLLAALVGHYDRLAASGAAPIPGYAIEKIAYCVILSTSGRIEDVAPLGSAVKDRLRPSSLRVPQGPKRASNIAANLFWDKTSYALGVTAKAKAPQTVVVDWTDHRVVATHKAFKQRQREVIGETDDAGLQALLLFLADWNPQDYPDLPNYEAMLDTNIVFRLDRPGEPFLHERPAARALIARSLSDDEAESGYCLVTGERGPIARLHPSIRGVRGAQSSGASIVSFNAAAFESYGKKQGANAPVSEAAVFAYTTALNALLADDRRRVQIGDASVVFWIEPPPGAAPETIDATEQVETLFGSVLGRAPEGPADGEAPPDPAGQSETLFAALANVRDGRPVRDLGARLDPRLRFYVLGLSPNAARLSVRFWLETNVGTFADRLRRHYEDLHLDPLPWRNRPPTVWRLLVELAPQGKVENAPGHLAGELTRAILTGLPYPRPLLSLALMRIRADRLASGLRVAIIKATLTRMKETIPVSLDRNQFGGYRLGRLFAVLEAAQYAGVGDVGSTIRDRYIGAASATPRRVFPILLRGAQDHLSAAAKKDRKGRAIRLEREIRQIVDGLDPDIPFPAMLGLEEQGRFFVGFYHQQNDLFIKRTPEEASDENSDAEGE